MPNDLDVLSGDGKIVVESPDGSRYVYTERDDGDYEWDGEESEVSQFPGTTVEDAVADAVDGEVRDVFPITFTTYASDDKNTREMCRQAGLPTEDDELIDLLWYYPGEFEITYELDRTAAGEYSLEALEMKYEGTRYTPE